MRSIVVAVAAIALSSSLVSAAISLPSMVARTNNGTSFASSSNWVNSGFSGTEISSTGRVVTWGAVTRYVAATDTTNNTATYILQGQAGGGLGSIVYSDLGTPGGAATDPGNGFGATIRDVSFTQDGDIIWFEQRTSLPATDSSRGFKLYSNTTNSTASIGPRNANGSPLLGNPASLNNSVQGSLFPVGRTSDGRILETVQNLGTTFVYSIGSTSATLLGSIPNTSGYDFTVSQQSFATLKFAQNGSFAVVRNATGTTNAAPPTVVRFNANGTLTTIATFTPQSTPANGLRQMFAGRAIDISENGAAVSFTASVGPSGASAYNALYVGDGTTLIQVARSGPNTTANIQLGSTNTANTFSNAQVNDKLNVIFSANTGTGVGALYSYDNGTGKYTAIVNIGDTVNTDVGNARITGNLVPLDFNNNGDLVFQANITRLSDNVALGTGLFTITGIPEPTALGWLAPVSLLLARRNRRGQ